MEIKLVEEELEIMEEIIKYHKNENENISKKKEELEISYYDNKKNGYDKIEQLFRNYNIIINFIIKSIIFFLRNNKFFYLNKRKNYN